MKKIIKNSGCYKKIIIRFLVVFISIVTVYTVGATAYENGNMEFITRVGIKLQRLRDGEWKTFGDLYGKDEKLIVAGEITGDNTVEQEFNFSEAMLDYDILCFAVYAATFNRTNTGELTFIIEQGDSSIQRTVNMSSMKDNDYIRFLINTDEFEPGKAVIRCYSDDGVAGNAVTLYLSSCIGYNDYVTVNGEQIPFNLKMKIYVPF